MISKACEWWAGRGGDWFGKGGGGGLLRERLRALDLGDE